jgi:hypothetical protein
VSNILASLSHAPEGLKRFASCGEYVRYEVKVPGRTRELAILGIALGSIMNAFRVELEPESTLAKRKEREG